MQEKITTEGGKNGIRCDTHLRRSTRAAENNESKEFIKDLTVFMKTNYSPIGKIPSLGYKECEWWNRRTGYFIMSIDFFSGSLFILHQGTETGGLRFGHRESTVEVHF